MSYAKKSKPPSEWTHEEVESSVEGTRLIRGKNLYWRGKNGHMAYLDVHKAAKCDDPEGGYVMNLGGWIISATLAKQIYDRLARVHGTW